MKLISLSILMVHITSLGAQKYEDEQFFLPHYQPGSSAFASDSSLYLPPETHSAIPYFAMKTTNKLPFQYLPPTGTKAPASFPTPFPVIMSSSLIPIFDDDDEPKNQNDHPISSPQTPQLKRLNSTQKSQHMKEPEKREMRPIPKTINYNYPVDRIDVKPAHFTMNAGPMQSNPANQASASRRTIPILTVDSLGLRNDGEMVKAGSFPTHQYIHAPGVFISSSTTEPAIPIIRLSNEMDLDGSFSYEALGADQTHYVQHSRMENMGSDKEEQVVEGSYSYVGDNGQTYTVHYIADSNGFRATGDHLPVAPPMPEIIQRAVQYNLAEEAKRPPHLKSWQEDEKAYDLEAEKNQRYPTSPIRNLFTGRTPEAFSYSFSPVSAQNNQNNQNMQNNQHNQNMQNNQNSLATAASSLQSVKTSIDFTKDQTQVKLNNGPISPQITFLASQGAHVPSVNTPQQSISRIFTTEKSNMPQLMNYEAVIKDSDQESNKALWRWQYGLNSNNGNQNSNKNTISRSAGDEIMINFSEMTPEQYTSMLQAQLEPNIRNNVQQMQYTEDRQANVYNNYNGGLTQKNPTQNSTEVKIRNEYQNLASNHGGTQNTFINQNYAMPNTQLYQNQNSYSYNQPPNKLIHNNNNQAYSNDVSPAPQISLSSSEPQNDWYKLNDESSQSSNQVKQADEPEQHTYHQSKIVTHHDFVPPSQTVTKSYDYEESFYESRKINDVTKDVKIDYANSSPLPQYFSESSTLETIDNDIKLTTTEQPSTTSSEATIKFIDFIQPDDGKTQTTANSQSSISFVDFIKPDDSKFKPVTNKNIDEYREQTTTQASIQEILENNIFLKNLVRTKKKENNSINDIETESKNIYQPTIKAEPKVEKVPKFIQYQTQMMNDIKGYKKKTTDLSGILNFVAQNNHFESSKVKPKNKPLNFSNLNQSNRMMYIPTHPEENDEQENDKTDTNNFRTLNHHQQEELRGIIKNYKILQRNNNNIRNEEDRMNQLRRDLSPPPLKMLHSPNLPPLGRAGPSMKSYLPPIFV
ncbi:putative mediator of RNA polymerase II transcription subunit 26 [Cydia pomonella]|uniref:putative mediator of RNA polymerase II transcription subunit 26 n=1 Tax=Cydia pomonella TaxID=82600 RepID=UPI002ADD75B4|nr:putative mediator of RNA polymerase II transcription subunit 26 [Cydia pomonella]